MGDRVRLFIIVLLSISFIINLNSTGKQTRYIFPNDYLDCIEYSVDEITVTETVTSTGVVMVTVTVTTTLGGLELDEVNPNAEDTVTICSTVMDGCNVYETVTITVIGTDQTSTSTLYVTQVTITETRVEYVSQTFTETTTVTVTGNQLNLNQATTTCTTTITEYSANSGHLNPPTILPTTLNGTLSNTPPEMFFNQTESVVESEGQLRLNISLIYSGLGIVFSLFWIRRNKIR